MLKESLSAHSVACCRGSRPGTKASIQKIPGEVYLVHAGDGFERVRGIDCRSDRLQLRSVFYGGADRIFNLRRGRVCRAEPYVVSDSSKLEWIIAPCFAAPQICVSQDP